MAESVVTITGVFENGPYQSKNGPFKRYDVKDAGGNRYQTTSDSLAAKAKELKGVPVKLVSHEETRGQFTNNVIDGIEAMQGPSVATQTAAAPLPTKDDRQERIERQSARRDAIAFATLGLVEIASVADLYSLADEFARYGREGQKTADEPARF